MRAVITGSTGLIGSELTAALLRYGGFEITALTRSPKSVHKLKYTIESYGRSITEIQVKEIDMFDFDELKQTVAEADVVFHTAAIVDLSGADVVAENVELTERVVEACLNPDIPQTRRPILIHISSIAALPQTIQSLGEASHYARSKFICENEVWRGHKMGLKVGVVSPAVVLGVGAPGSAGLQPLIKRAQKGLPFYTDGATGFVDVRDVAKAMVTMALDEKLLGQRFVLSAVDMSYKELLTRIAVAVGKKPPVIKVGKVVFEITAWLLKLFMKRPLLTSEMGGFLFSKNSYDGGEIERCSTFRYTPIDETIRYITDSSRNVN